MDNTSDVWMNQFVVHPYIGGIVFTLEDGPYILTDLELEQELTDLTDLELAADL